MAFIVGRVVRPQTRLGITLDGLGGGFTRISAQYTYSGDTGGIYPTKGWLRATIVTATAPSTTGLRFLILPGFGDGGDVPAAYGKVDATITADNDELLYVGEIKASLMGGATTYEFTWFIGNGNLIQNGAEAWGLTAFERDKDLECDLPRTWSLLVTNSTGQTLGTGCFVDFQPVFDQEAGA